ncbi:hypothetical protein V2J09_019925 [Rumex salicifolius]
MVEVKIRCAHTVKPSEATWTGILPLSEWDQAAGAAYVPYIYFFKAGQEEIVGVLKESLSRCLVHFYPMAGRIHRVGGGRLELRCSGEGAVLLEAETSSEVAEMGDFMDSNKFKELIYSVDYSTPTHELALLYAQVTVFACGGFSLGITMSHAVTDGLGGLHVTSEWARLTRGEGLGRIPYLTREVLRAGEPARETAAAKQPTPMPTPPPPPPAMKETTMVNLALTKKQVEKLKMAANAGNDGSQRPYSRYEVLTAHIWRCACKARGQVEDGEAVKAVGFGIDSRMRIEPPLPPNFWGNAVLMVVAKSRADRLVSQQPAGLEEACSKVRATIQRVTNDYIWSDIESLKRLDDLSLWRGLPDPDPAPGGPTHVFPDVMVISWLTLPIYGMDFGWGKEIHMGPATHTHDGTAMILPGPAHQGSVVVAICLQLAHVDSFKSHFYQDLAAAA